MSGGKPKVTSSPQASLDVQQGVYAVNEFVTVMVGTPKRLASITKQAQALIPEAVKLPAKVPKAVKAAGLKPANIPKIVSAVRNNVKITRKIPKEAKALIKTSVESVKTVSSALK